MPQIQTRLDLPVRKSGRAGKAAKETMATKETTATRAGSRTRPQLMVVPVCAAETPESLLK